MSSSNTRRNSGSLYPQVVESNPERNSPFLSNPPSSSSLYPTIHPSQPSKQEPYPSQSTSSLYPSIEMRDLVVEELFPDTTATVESSEDILIKIPGAIAHLIDRQRSLEIGCGDFTLARVRQGENVIAVLVRVADVQWPLAKDVAAVKLDESHYFFSLRVPPTERGADSGGEEEEEEDLLNYGLTFASKGQEGLLKELDGMLGIYAEFSVERVSQKAEVLDGSVAREVAPAELESGPKREMMEKRSAAYWTTLAPNVEDYSGAVARVIAAGSGQLIKGILWGGDVTVDGLKWGNEIMKRKMEPNSKPTKVSRQAIKRLKRVKRVTKMSEKVATGVLSGVVKVAGFFTSSLVNSIVGKKFFSLLPGEIVLASLDGFGKVCDAVEVAGKNVLSTSSVVTTEIVSHRYGEQAGELTHDGVSAAGHVMGTAWAVFKVRRAFNPKSIIKPTTLVKSAAKVAAAEAKAKKKQAK